MACSVFPSMFSSDRRSFNVFFLRGLLLLPPTLAFISSLFFFSYIPSTSKLFIHLENTRFHVDPPLEFLTISPSPPTVQLVRTPKTETEDIIIVERPSPCSEDNLQHLCSNESNIMNKNEVIQHDRNSSAENELNTRQVFQGRKIPLENQPNDHKDGVFHDADLFQQNYQEMSRTLKIFVYPHSKDEPFSNVLLPERKEPGGNYASESYFKKALMKSHFITKDPSKTDLFYLPFSIASLRHDRRIGVGGIQGFVSDYVYDISHRYPFWNRSGGADHFYVACHSVGRSAMEKAVQVKLNAIQVVCSSSYFLPGYVSHKDASIPQIWPRKGDPPNRPPSKRTKLAFYAGAMNSRVRQTLVQTWKNDSQISVHQSRLKTSYSEALLGSKFCLHAKGFEVNTARIGDALYYGCVPVILADHYDLPYTDILNWNSFSVVFSTFDIPLLKKILRDVVETDEYLRLQRNVLKVRRHFQWHNVPVEYDAFYMVMYELWLRRSHVRVIDL